MAIQELRDLSAPPDGLFNKARVGKKPVGPTPLAQVHSPTASRAPMIRTGSESWQDAPSSSSQGPFTPSTEVTYATPGSRHSHHPSAQTAMRYPQGYSHPPPQHPHARSMSLGYPVDAPPHYAPPHPQHHGWSNSTSEHGQYHAPYHAYEYPPRASQYPGYYPLPTTHIRARTTVPSFSLSFLQRTPNVPVPSAATSPPTTELPSVRSRPGHGAARQSTRDEFDTQSLVPSPSANL